MSAAIEVRLARLEQQATVVESLRREVAALRQENESLRAATTSVGPSMPRRDLLKGAAVAAGAVGLALVGMRPASADAGAMYYGVSNDAGVSFTQLWSGNSINALGLFDTGAPADGDPRAANALRAASSFGTAIFARSDQNSEGHGLYAEALGTGHAVWATKNTSGHAVLGEHTVSNSSYAAIAGVTKGSGPGTYGRGDGTGNGVWGQITDSTKVQSAVRGSTAGSGAGVEGTSRMGRGGVFKGQAAQVKLIPSSATTKPATGQRGDLFVDSTGRLWYCKTANSTTGWTQLA